MSRLVSLGLLAAALLPASAGVRRRPLDKTGEAVKKDEEGFRFRLGEGGEEARAGVRAPAAAGTSLDEAETERVLARLPAWSAPDDERPFALREASLPPPRPGRTVKEPFPPPGEASRPQESGEGGPLSVLRRAPEGALPPAPPLAGPFSQP